MPGSLSAWCPFLKREPCGCESENLRSPGSKGHTHILFTFPTRDKSQKKYKWKAQESQACMLITWGLQSQIMACVLMELPALISGLSDLHFRHSMQYFIHLYHIPSPLSCHFRPSKYHNFPGAVTGGTKCVPVSDLIPDCPAFPLDVPIFNREILEGTK